jgi:hypothetical protein
LFSKKNTKIGCNYFLAVLLFQTGGSFSPNVVLSVAQVSRQQHVMRLRLHSVLNNYDNTFLCGAEAPQRDVFAVASVALHFFCKNTYGCAII